jgi:predicted RNA binding protein YcfA (HicA-like mRNA interferase family)
MPKNIPSLKMKQLLRILNRNDCRFYRQGKGDHELYVRVVGGSKRVVPIDTGCREFSPAYVLRILRQFGFTDDEIDSMF